MGILSSDPYENAWIILGLILASVIGLSVLITLPYFAYQRLSGVGTGGTDDFISKCVSLIPYIFFFAGPVIDGINANLQYSKASLVALISSSLTALLGSDKYAEFIHKIIGVFPPLKTPGDAPGVPDKWNWWIIIIWLIVGVLIFLPMMIGQLSCLAWGGTLAIGIFVIVSLLAGYGLLGDITGTTSGFTGTYGATPPVTNPFRGGGLTVDNYCVTPGLEKLQTRFAPVGIIVTSSILSSHLFESIDTGNNENAFVVSALIVLSFMADFSVMFTKDCLSKYKYSWLSPFISLLIGTGSGAAAYYTSKCINTESFTSSDESGGVFHPPPSQSKQTQSKTDTKIVVGPQPDVSEPVDDQDAFVCEAYKDGELVTSTIVD